METKKIKNRSELIVYILAVLGIVVLINYAATRWFGRIDMTEGKEYSISDATKAILKDLDDIVNIRVFFSDNLPPHVHTTVTDVKDILSEYQAFAGNKLLITWEDPAKDEDAKEAARSLNIPEIQMQTFEKDKAQVINGYLGIGIMFENKNEAIPVVQNLQNLEYDLTMAIMKVARSSAPKVGILKTDTMPYIPPNLRQQMQMTDQTEDNFAPLYEKLKTN
jgi:ABC-2 type transport system permease protein